MANRFPITVNTSTNRLEELPANDNINLSNSGIFDGTSIGSSGQILKSTGTGVTWTNPNYLTAETSHADVVVDGDFTSQGLMKRGSSAGSYSIIQDNSPNWNLAYSWGNHATAGYLTSIGPIDDHSDVVITSPVSGQVLKYNGTTWINANPTTGSINLDELIDVVVNSPLNGQVLRYNGTAWINDTITTGALNLDGLTDVSVTSPSINDVLRYDGAGWVNGSINTGLPSRVTSSGTTSSIANGASSNISIGAAKTYVLHKIQTSAAAWVTLYTDSTSRTNDSTRTEFTDPLPGSGVIAEVITTGAATQIITPGVVGWNNDSPASNAVYIKVVNKSGSTQTITVTLHYLKLEE